MPAAFIKVGEPAHNAERQALRFLVDNLPSDYTVFGNAWLVEREGVVYELDAVVSAPHAIFVVEIKGYRGPIEGTDHDWYIPHPIPSPLKLNRKTAQVLKSRLKDRNYQAGQVWVQGLVFLSATTNNNVRGSASRDRLHTRKTILAALQDPKLVERLSGGRSLAPASQADSDLVGLLTGSKRGPRPIRRVREYEIIDRIDHQETFTELLGKNTLSGAERVLRIYSIPDLATDAKRDRINERARWEAQVLGRIGRIDDILSADQPFEDEAGIVLPFENFQGITLTTWLERYGPTSRKKIKADLHARTDLWIRIAHTLDQAHGQGVVHRLLRPEVILVEDKPEPTAIRVTGFDLAKQLAIDATVLLTTIADERLIFAAPEVLGSFSSAEPASDQFSLGAILALLLTGKPLFESTRHLMDARRLLRHVRDMAPRIPLSLDEAVNTMLELQPNKRFPKLTEAIEGVRRARDPGSRKTLHLFPKTATAMDPDNLEPQTRLGSDYEIISRLGQGGMSVVYAARHLVSGRTRALKISAPKTSAEEALRGEYRVLSGLDHPNIVRVIDLTKMVEGRLTLVMERVGGQNLRQWLNREATLDPSTQRRLAEDLLAGLDYLEQKGITHKDLKPENLLVADGRLTIIDFSLADVAEDAPFGGTALYRDPASARWTHGTDRYAAALCLFELYAGRHAFDSRVPEPTQQPMVTEEDIAPTGLVAFFRKALCPEPELRFASVRAMRDALLVALGDDVATEQPASDGQIDATTPLHTAGLSRRAVNALRHRSVHTVGQLLNLGAHEIRNIANIGTKTAADIINLQDRLRARGLQPSAPSLTDVEPMLMPDLADSPEHVDRLPLASSLRAALLQNDLPTVGSVASLTRAKLLAVPGIGRAKLAQVVESLFSFRDHTPEDSGIHTLDRIWEHASRALTDSQRSVVEQFVGITGEPQQQGDIADTLGKTKSQVSTDFTTGIERLDTAALDNPLSALDTVLDGFGGIVKLSDLGQRFEEAWPAGIATGAGLLRLLIRIAPGRAHLVEADGVDGPIVARPGFDRDTVRGFVGETSRIAYTWPPVDPESARRTVAGLLPEYDGDALALAVRLCEDAELASTGHLFVGPVDARHSIAFVLDQTRDPIALDELEARVRETFGDGTPYPTDPHKLLETLGDLNCRVQGDLVIPGRTSSVVAPAKLPADALPQSFGNERSPEQVVRDMLVDAAGKRSFRMLVTPPESHLAIARSVARSLDATWLSFEDEFFRDHGADIAMLERAERFVAQRDALTEAAEDTLFRLLDEHGRSGRLVVLGDTALFGLCEALDLPRRLYDETLSGNRGFWVLVVPGVIHNRQPRFNEDAPLWHLEGATLPLLTPLPAPARTEELIDEGG